FVSVGPPRVRIAPLPTKPPRQWIRSAYRLDDIHREPSSEPQIRSRVHPPGEHEVVRRQGRLVVPDQAGSQSEPRLHSAVRRQTPGLRTELWKRLGQIGHRSPTVV